MTELHAHTTASDGLLAPEELVALCHARGIRVLAVTDHDTTHGIREAAEAASALGVQLLAGIEASVRVNGEGVHLLGLGIDAHDDGIGRLTASCIGMRHDRARGILDRLDGLGVNVSWEEVASRAGAVVTRPHIAASLVAGGFVDTPREAFDRYLGWGRPAHVPLETAPAADWIRAIHGAGGVAVIAHPGDWTAHRTITDLVSIGLDGFEALHPSHHATLVTYYQDLADSLGLVVSGGSDFHGRLPAEADRLGTFSPRGTRLAKLGARIRSGVAIQAWGSNGDVRTD